VEKINAKCSNSNCQSNNYIIAISKKDLNSKKCINCGSKFKETVQSKAKNIETHLGIKKGSTEGNAIGVIIMVAFIVVCVILILKTNNF
jgi:Zn ribbon nucleic-acid-binding protein